MSEPKPALDDPFDGLVTKETGLRIDTFKDITPFSIHNLPRLEKYNKPNKGRHYKLPSRIEVPSVTNVLGILDKPALMWWAASVERDMVVERAAQFFKDCAGQLQAPKHAIVTMLRNYLPKQQARFKKSKEATDIGQETHDLIQWQCKMMIAESEKAVYQRPKTSDYAELAFMAWEEWANSVNFEPLLVEQTVWSDIMKAAGTVDCYSIQDWPEPGERRHFVDDWKSSKRSKTAPNGIYPESLIQVCTYAEMLVELGVAPENTMGCIVRLPKSLDDHIFEEAGQGAVDHVEIMPETRVKLAEGFHHIRHAWTFMKEGMAKV